MRGAAAGLELSTDPHPALADARAAFSHEWEKDALLLNTPHFQKLKSLIRPQRGRPLLPLAGEGGPAEPGRMRGAAAGLELPVNPHPTSLREAAFSHEWEKDAPSLDST